MISTTAFLTIGLLATLIVLWLLRVRPCPPILNKKPTKEQIEDSPDEWKGTPIDKKDRFVNYEFPYYQNYLQILLWIPSHIISLVRNRNFRLPAIIHSNKSFLDYKNVMIWLGHCSYYMNVNGTRLLIDPVFYNVSVYKRHSPNPLLPSMFQGIDYIIISHDHEDHCNIKSISQITKLNPKAQILTGLNMDQVLRKNISRSVDVKCADWYEQYEINAPIGIWFVPTRHYSKRIFRKFNSTLWGGFILRLESEPNHFKTLFFGGDSGYGSHFKSIKKVFAPDIILLGIGAYEPNWFMSCNHMRPKEVVKAFDDCGAKTLIPMHYGTFCLSNENMEEPVESLLTLMKHRRVIQLVPGEVLHFKDISVD